MIVGANEVMAIILALIIIIPGCIGAGDGTNGDGAGGAGDGAGGGELITLVVWSTFEADSLEDEVFLDAIATFDAQHPSIAIDVSNRPFMQAADSFRVAAQGGEAPDLMRFASDQLGQVGAMRVDGFPLLEDLRPHLTPIQRNIYDAQALSSMRVGGDLLALPASFDCVSLIYNADIFAAEGVEPPNANWSWQQMLEAADALSHGNQVGLSVPLKDPYRWLAFQRGFGGELFAANGVPTLDSNGSAAALEAWLALDQSNGGMVPTGTSIDTMKNHFREREAAMIIDGPWNWATYSQARINVAQAPLPMVNSSGERISPMVTYKGWSVSKQSLHKEEAVELALWLSSPEVQKRFALETWTLPTAVSVQSDSEVIDDPVLSGFLGQAEYGFPAPTTREMSMVWDPLSAAIEQVYAGKMSAEEALSEANQQLLEEIDG
jgi:arabinogalactan oligomer/maltooligosaccharide transport system substrate-binding protein